jgi:hypothetical protein
MNITKKFDRAFQWAGEKMGGEAKTNMSEDFKMLETEMALRFEGELTPLDVRRSGHQKPMLTVLQAWNGSRDR